MTKLKAVLLMTSATLMLAACGESFRAKQISSEAANGTGNPATTVGSNANTQVNLNTSLQSQIPISSVQNFSDGFKAVLSNTAGTDSLFRSIKAFTVIKRIASPNIDSVTLEAVIVSSCNTTQVINGMVRVDQIKEGVSIRLIPKGGLNVTVQCHDQSCNTMSAAVFQNDVHSDRGVLIGLQKASNSSNMIHQMNPVNISGVTGYRQPLNVVEYGAACSSQQAQNSVTVNSNGNNQAVVIQTNNNTAAGNFVIDPSNQTSTQDPQLNNNGSLGTFFTL